MTADPALLSAVLESIPLAAVVLDPAGRIAFANPAMADLSGWSVRQLVGRSWFGRLTSAADTASLRSQFAEAVLPGGPSQLGAFEVPILTRAGGKQPRALDRHGAARPARNRTGRGQPG